MTEFENIPSSPPTCEVRTTVWAWEHNEINKEYRYTASVGCGRAWLIGFSQEKCLLRYLKAIGQNPIKTSASCPIREDLHKIWGS